MGKIWIEVCLISARGLRRTSSLWKLQWFAVGWIDPTNKYCTKIDASGNTNSFWKTKISILMDTDKSNLQELALHLEVYSREPIFLRQKLRGTTTVALKEFLDKYAKNSNVFKPIEEVGSFQLRAKNSNKPQGFIDVSIRISPENQEAVSNPGDHEGFKLDRPNQSGPSQIFSQYAMPYPGRYNNPNPSVAGPSYRPPLPPPPANLGYLQTFLPRTHNMPPGGYISMPSTGAGGATRANGTGFAAGIGGGALAAGFVVFGDDFMSGYDLPGGFQDASIRISADPPF